MATLNELLTTYAAYNVQRGTKTGIRLPYGVAGPDGWVPCSESSLGCGEIVGMTAIPGTVYWMPQGAGATSGTTTVIIPPTSGADPRLAEYRRKAVSDYNTEVIRELTVLLASLDKTSAAYESAHRALEGALSPVVAAEIARLDTINDPAAFAPTEAAALARIDATAEDAFARWRSATATAGADAVQQAGVVTQVIASGAGGGGLAPDRALAATDAAASLVDIPGANTAASWYASVRAKFLRAPDELRADLAGLDQLRTMAAGSSHPALSQLGALDTTFQNLLSDWTQAAVTAAAVDEALSKGGSVGGDTVARIVSLAGVMVTFFARKATAEALLDAIAQQVLTPDEYATWKTSHPLGGGMSLTPWLIGAGIVVAALVMRRRRR